MSGTAEMPCDRCGIRADIGCKHRKPIGPPPPNLAAQAAALVKKRGKVTNRFGGAGGIAQEIGGDRLEELRRSLQPALERSHRGFRAGKEEQ